MKISVLGCSGGGSLGYGLSSFLIDETLLFDAGSVAQKLSIEDQLKINGVFVSHCHFDHIRDLPMIVDNFLVQPGRTLKVYALPSVIEALKKHIFNDWVWPDFTKIPNSSNPVLTFVEVREGSSINLGDYTVIPVLTEHTVPSCGYLLKGEKSVFYSGDTGPGSRFWKDFEDNWPDALIIEVSFPDFMENIALASKHYTPKLLFEELSLLKTKPKELLVFHLKPMFRDEIIKELKHYGENSGIKVRVLRDSEVVCL